MWVYLFAFFQNRTEQHRKHFLWLFFCLNKSFFLIKKLLFQEESGFMSLKNFFLPIPTLLLNNCKDFWPFCLTERLDVFLFLLFWCFCVAGRRDLREENKREEKKTKEKITQEKTGVARCSERGSSWKSWKEVFLIKKNISSFRRSFLLKTPEHQKIFLVFFSSLKANMFRKELVFFFKRKDLLKEVFLRKNQIYHKRTHVQNKRSWTKKHRTE